MSDDTFQGAQVPIAWPLEHDLPSQYANHVAISTTGDSVYITFGEFRPPITPKGRLSEEQRSQLEESDSFLIKPVATLVINPGLHLAMTRLLINMFNDEELNDVLEYINKIAEERKSEGK